MPAIAYARELWRFGEPALAQRAAAMTPGECADIGQRAGELSSSVEVQRLWPDGPRGETSAMLLAVVEHLEGQARPCSRTRRLPEKSLPDELRPCEDHKHAQLEALIREMSSRPD